MALDLLKLSVAEGCISTRPATNHPFGFSKGVAAMQSSEQWLPVVGLEELYEVSDQGRVRSLDRVSEINHLGTVRYRRSPGRLMKPYTHCRSGHSHISLSVCSANQKHTKIRTTVHRLVLEAFVGPCPDGMEACHANDVPNDNRLVNLRWGTREENLQDRILNGQPHWNAAKTHCKHGHEFTDENTRWRRFPKESGKADSRVCKTCVRHEKRRRLGWTER